jgi:hypothetical protein
VCPWERLVIISYATGLFFALEGLGHLQQLLLLSFIYSYFIYLHYQIPLKTRLLVFTVNPWSKPLVNTFCSSLGSTLLFIESTTIHPLYLWVISRHGRELLDTPASLPRVAERRLRRRSEPCARRRGGWISPGSSGSQWHTPPFPSRADPRQRPIEEGGDKVKVKGLNCKSGNHRS